MLSLEKLLMLMELNIMQLKYKYTLLVQILIIHINIIS
jgi:hypothetical protein